MKMTSTFYTKNPTQTTLDIALVKNVQKTSVEAYYSINNLGKRQREVLECIKNFPNRTDQELTSLLKKTDPNYVRPRRFELEKLKLIGAHETRECMITHKKAWTWKITEKGIKCYENLNSGREH